MAANAALLALKAQQEAQQRAEEEAFRAAMMAKFAEDDRIEQLNAQKRRLKVGIMCKMHTGMAMGPILTPLRLANMCLASALLAAGGNVCCLVNIQSGYQRCVAISP